MPTSFRIKMLHFCGAFMRVQMAHVLVGRSPTSKWIASQITKATTNAFHDVGRPLIIFVLHYICLEGSLWPFELHAFGYLKQIVSVRYPELQYGSSYLIWASAFFNKKGGKLWWNIYGTSRVGTGKWVIVKLVSGNISHIWLVSKVDPTCT